ncbi:hypothetical protein BKI52_08360 [marine bacterium AO1-C]|nr:hypothetical protein BKI52_08360 [marine bacterium AO1-C]
MKKFALLVLAFICCWVSNQAQSPVLKHVTSKPRLQQKNYKFIENKNQWPSSVLYRAAIPSGFMFLKKDGVQYTYYDSKAISRLHLANPTASAASRTKLAKPVQNKIKAHGIEVKFLGANPLVSVQPEELLTEKWNFYKGKNPLKWATDVRSFRTLYYRDIYASIDLKFYEQNKHLKYEFIVAPNTSPQAIHIQYNGAQGILLKEGNLAVITSLGEIIEKKPYCYQIINGQKVTVKANFKLVNNEVSFEFPYGYNPNFELVIDPELIFSSYSGSIPDNWGNTAAFDLNENLYAGGTVFDPGSFFPNNGGEFDVTFAGNIDIGILKFSEDGTNLLYGAYLGGEDADVPHSLVVNSANELIILGTTASDSLPVTGGVFDDKFNGGNFVTPLGGMNFLAGSDLFLAKISPNGNQLRAATYVGGSDNDGLHLANTSIKNYGDTYRGDVFVDGSNNIYVASTTLSNDFPLVGAIQSNLAGEQDAVIFKMSSDLSTMMWSTYLGGSGFDGAYSIKVFKDQEVFVTGATTSAGLPTSPDALHTTAIGSDDGFVARISNDGSTLERFTYLGTTSADQGFFVDLDTNSNVYVFGQTFGNYPVTAGVYSNANARQFIHKMSPDLNRTIYSTVIGSGRSTPDISPTAFLVNDCENVYITGWGGNINVGYQPPGYFSPPMSGSSTLGMPVTFDGFQQNTDGSDFYIAVLSTDAQDLVYGTFFGTSQSRGEHVDGGTCRFSKRGVVYHSVCSCGDASSFPTTPGAYSNVNRSSTGNCNNAAFKFDVDILTADFDIQDSVQNNVTEICAPATITFTYKGQGASTYDWSIDGGIGQIGTSRSIDYRFNQEGLFTITLQVQSPPSCLRVASVTKTFRVFKNNLTVSDPKTICKGEQVNLSVTSQKSVVSYEWNPGSTLNDSTIANPIATPEQSTNYVVTVRDADGCDTKATVPIEVLQIPTTNFSATVLSECGINPRVKLTADPDTSLTQTWDMGNGETFEAGKDVVFYTYPESGQYTIKYISSNGACTQVDSITVTIFNQVNSLPNVVTPNDDGKNDLFVVPFPNHRIAVYNRWGRKIFERDNYQNDWGGEVEAGVYYYVLTSPDDVKCKGWVKVVK